MADYGSVTLNTDPYAIDPALGSIATSSQAAAALANVKGALDAVSTLRASIGASEQQLNAFSNNLGIQAQSLTAAQSGIQDANLADEVVNLTKFQILNQSSTAAVAKADDASRQLLAMLQ